MKRAINEKGWNNDCILSVIRNLLKLSAFAFLLVPCQAQPVLRTAVYTVNKVWDMSSAHLLSFKESHSRTMTGDLQWSGMVDDSLYYVTLAASIDTLYALNCYSEYLRVLPLRHLKSKQIIASHTFCYHNHDSIFFCLGRGGLAQVNKRFNRNDKDILLIDGKGVLLNEYSLDSLPDIYFGDRSNGRYYPWNDNLDERFFAGGLLVDAVTKIPYVTHEGFSALNPKIMALCNLEDKSIRMLNIRYPVELQEKKYTWPPKLWVKVIGPKEMLVGFSVTSYIYRYDLDKDTMIKLEVQYDETFQNTDSASMTKGKDYPAMQFGKPVWSSVHSCYLRDIYFHHLKDYQPFHIVEMLDSTYNHIGYVYADKKRGWREIRCHADGTLTVADKGGYGRHVVQLSGQLQETRLSVFFKRNMVKKPKVKKYGNGMQMPDYMRKMNLPDSCIALLVNMKYPCGPCMQDLALLYKENFSQMAEKNVYYLFFDPEHNNDEAVWKELENYGVRDFKNIRVDHKLLPKVSCELPNGMEAQYSQNIFLVKMGDSVGYTLLDFQDPIRMLHLWLQRKTQNNNKLN